MADFDLNGNLTKATFAEAAKEAASLAKVCNLPVCIERSGLVWAILDFPLLIEISQNVQFDADLLQDDDQSYALEEDEDTRSDLVQEHYEYQDGMVRSDEEGWFYED